MGQGNDIRVSEERAKDRAACSAGMGLGEACETARTDDGHVFGPGPPGGGIRNRRRVWTMLNEMELPNAAGSSERGERRE